MRAALKAGVGLNERIPWFSLLIFERHDRHRQAGESLVGAKRGEPSFLDSIKKWLVELIAEDIRKVFRPEQFKIRILLQARPKDLGQVIRTVLFDSQNTNWLSRSHSPLFASTNSKQCFSLPEPPGRCL